MKNTQKYFLLHYLVICLFNLSCEKKYDYNITQEAEFVTYNEPIKLQKNGIGIPLIGSVLISNQDFLMFSDNKSQKLNIFTFDGVFIQEIGQLGEGPGEYTRLSSYGFVDGRIVLSDPAKDMLKYYSYNGEFLFEKINIREKNYSINSRLIYESKYGELMVMTELEKKPYNLMESAVLFSVNDKSINFARYPKELVFLGARDIFPFVIIDENFAFIVYSELGLIEKWNLDKNELISNITIANGFNPDNERFTIESYLDEEKYIKKRQKHSIISHTFQNNSYLYILVYDNIKLDKSNTKIDKLDTILQEYTKSNLKLTRKIHLNYSISGIVEDIVISVNYDKKYGEYFYRKGFLKKK